VIRYRK